VSALATGLGLLTWVRMLERANLGRALLCGLCLGAALLVKFPYGLQLVAVVGTAAALDGLPRVERSRALLCLFGVGIGLALVLAWWFYLPLPHGLARGVEHAHALRTHLTTAAGQSSHGPGFVLVAWPLMSFISLPAFCLQLVALGWAVLRWRESLVRLLLLAALVGPVALTLYPFRLDRFLVPFLPVGFALSGALCALAQARAPAGRRFFIGAVTALILVATSGLGAESLTRLAFPDLPKELPAEVRENLDALKSPYAFRRAPAAGPAGMEEVLAAAVEHLDPSQPFTWIGGTTRELPLSLLAWSLFAARGEDAVLWREPDLEQHLWTDPGWDEPAFRKWASRYPQIGTLDPADPLGRTDREFEQRYVTWIAQHPGFELQHRREVQLDGERTHVVSIYRRH
jgi:hypothetical protein